MLRLLIVRMVGFGNLILPQLEAKHTYSEMCPVTSVETLDKCKKLLYK